MTEKHELPEEWSYLSIGHIEPLALVDPNGDVVLRLAGYTGDQRCERLAVALRRYLKARPKLLELAHITLRPGHAIPEGMKGKGERLALEALAIVEDPAECECAESNTYRMMLEIERKELEWLRKTCAPAVERVTSAVVERLRAEGLGEKEEEDRLKAEPPTPEETQEQRTEPALNQAEKRLAEIERRLGAIEGEPEDPDRERGAIAQIEDCLAALEVGIAEVRRRVEVQGKQIKRCVEEVNIGVGNCNAIIERQEALENTSCSKASARGWVAGLKARIEDVDRDLLRLGEHAERQRPRPRCRGRS